MPVLRQNVTFFGVLANRIPVNVGAVYGVIFAAFDASAYGTLAFEIQNPDVTQVLDVSVDIGTALGGPFFTSLWNGLGAIQPSETRSAIFSKPGQSIIRVIAKADGVGVNNVILSISGLATFVT